MKYIEDMYGKYIAWNIKNSQELLRVLIQYTDTPLTLLTGVNSMNKRIDNISHFFLFTIKTMRNFEVFYG